MERKISWALMVVGVLVLTWLSASGFPDNIAAIVFLAAVCVYGILRLFSRS